MFCMSKRKVVVDWVSSEHEAKYWYTELEVFAEQCWQVVKDLYDLDKIRELFKDIDELLRKHKVGCVTEAMVGATMIRRFLFYVYPDIDIEKKLRFEKEEVPKEWTIEIRRVRDDD